MAVMAYQVHGGIMKLTYQEFLHELTNITTQKLFYIALGVIFGWSLHYLKGLF